MLFVDLDVLAVGPVVRDVSQDFDRYWNSASAYPVMALVDPAVAQDENMLPRRAATLRAAPEAQRYLAAMRSSPFVEQLAQRALPLEWGTTRLVSDDPDKAIGKIEASSRMVIDLGKLLGEPKQQVDLVSPYFVPSKKAAQQLADIARNGVQVRVLTNSLEATDVAAVHAGYAKWRHELLGAGVALYELRRRWGPALPDTGRGRFGGSASSLHAKTFGVDGRRVFVGSFNMDRRSIDLNTEMGFVIDSPPLARRLRQTLDESIPGTAYEVRLDAEGKLYWLERSDGKVLRYAQEPGTTVWKRAGVGILSILPIDWLL